MVIKKFWQQGTVKSALYMFSFLMEWKTVNHYSFSNKIDQIKEHLEVAIQQNKYLQELSKQLSCVNNFNPNNNTLRDCYS